MERQWVCLSCGFESTRLQVLMRSDSCVRCGYGMHAPRDAWERKKRASAAATAPAPQEQRAGTDQVPLAN